MNFADRVVLMLASTAKRAALFDDIALAQIASAAYDTSRATVQPPYRAVFDEMKVGIPVPRPGTVEGQFGDAASAERSLLNLTVSGMGSSAWLVDALWKGSIVATATMATSKITGVRVGFPDLGRIDARIVQDLGALPADAVALADARRTRLVAALTAEAAVDATVVPELLDREIRAAGAADINDYFRRASGTRAFGPVQVQWSAPVAPAASPRPLPISAPLIVRETLAGLAQLLADTRMAIDYLEQAGHGQPDGASGLPQRQPLVPVWLVSSAALGDVDLPGADPPARRKALGDTLAELGIGLAVVA